MFERLKSPAEIYAYKLQAAMKMEEKVIEMLEQNIEHAQADAVYRLLQQHLEETRLHAENLRNAFVLIGEDPDSTASPAILGIEKEGKANLRKTESSLADLTILQAAIETEHHEIAVYQNLITLARAVGHGDTVTFLAANLRQEQEALAKAGALLTELAAEKAHETSDELSELTPRASD